MAVTVSCPAVKVALSATEGRLGTSASCGYSVNWYVAVAVAGVGVLLSFTCTVMLSAVVVVTALDATVVAAAMEFEVVVLLPRLNP
jgi:hypothetical protein